MHQIRLQLGVCPRPCWGSLAYSAPPDPLAGNKGPTSMGKRGEGRERRGPPSQFDISEKIVSTSMKPVITVDTVILFSTNTHTPDMQGRPACRTRTLVAVVSLDAVKASVLPCSRWI